MKRKTPLILVLFPILVNVVIFVALRYWRAQKQRNADEVSCIAGQYAMPVQRDHLSKYMIKISAAGWQR